MPANELPRPWHFRLVRLLVTILMLTGLCSALGCGGGDQPSASTGPPKGDANKRMPK